MGSTGFVTDILFCYLGIRILHLPCILQIYHTPSNLVFWRVYPFFGCSNNEQVAS
jgi:hypothetical protein